MFHAYLPAFSSVYHIALQHNLCLVQSFAALARMMFVLVAISKLQATGIMAGTGSRAI